MFIKSGLSFLTYFIPINIVIKVLDSESRSPRFNMAGQLQVQLILSFFRDLLNKYQELLGAEW